MAIADDLRSFLETRLLALDPSIDLSTNSPAQTQVIEPTITRFADDPYSTVIPQFIKDRLTQEYPELAVDGGGLLDDILSKPLQLLLEPFKRESELIKSGQSLINATFMSEGEADALAANWFETRNEGSRASGGVRLYYSAPTNARVTTDKRCYTADGLAFFPAQNYFLSAQQMLFNRQGSLYFLDIVVKAEGTGDEYNVSRAAIIGIDDVPNVVRVSNLSDFSDGSPRESNDEFIGRLDQALTEKSLVTKRGILTRTPALFDSVRALQVIGAGDEAMNRDILTGTGEGFLHIVGTGAVYGDWLWVSSVSFRDDGPSNNIIPQAGDKVRIHPGPVADPITVVKEATVVEILSSSPAGSYLFLLDAAPYATGITQASSIALFKKGEITISSIPGGISSGFVVADNTVHLGGHTDVYVRPVEDTQVTGILSKVTDDQPLVALLDLVATGSTNQVSSAVAATASGFVALGVVNGDTLVIETGTGFAGTYRILEIDSPSLGDLRLDSTFSAGAVDLRARVVRGISVDLVTPKIPKLPFNTGSVSDLLTTVGSTEFRFSTTNIQLYGAAIGDTINVLDGPDAGEYVIQSFPPSLGGQGAIVDRLVSSTKSGLRFEVYTRLDGLEIPLVRLKSLEVLDSTGQGTGVIIPYGDAVDIRPECDLEGAGRARTTLDKRLIILPDMLGYWDGGGLLTDDVGAGNVTDATDAKYTQGLDSVEGVVRIINALGGPGNNPIDEIEIDVPPFMWNGKRDKLLALTSIKDPEFLNVGDSRTSDLAESRIGDALTILEGPNKGEYVIQDMKVYPLWSKTEKGHRKVALIQVSPPFKVDPLRSALDFMTDNGLVEFVGGGDDISNELFGFLQYAADWDNPSGFYEVFLTELHSRLTTAGVLFASVAALKEFFDPLIRSGYVVGPAARGNLRLYFLDPVSVEFYYGDDPTTFVSAVDPSKKFTIDPASSPSQILPESEIDTLPAEWNRNLGIGFVSPGSDVFSTSGLSFVLRGISPGDTIEFRRPVNDIPATENMTSSWLALTQTGSNIVQLVTPPSGSGALSDYGDVDNFTTLLPGQLLFLDSGPDLGPYTITKVLSGGVVGDWNTALPIIRVQVDKVLSHTTVNLPVVADLDFSSGLPAYQVTTGNTFPMTLTGKQVKFEASGDGGLTYAAPVEHTFGAGPFTAIGDVVADLNGNGTFAAEYYAAAVGNELAIGTIGAVGVPRAISRLAPGTSAYTDLPFVGAAITFGITGASPAPLTKRIHGTGLSGVAANDWVTVYAAKSTDLLGTVGDDVAYLGTYKVTAAGVSLAPQYGAFQEWVELDRSEDFPAWEGVAVRWVKHSAPAAAPASTSGGGKELSSQFVRFRTYASISELREVVSIPWGSDPLDPLSTHQLTLDTPLINTGAGQENQAHLAPYRILRRGVKRVSSTTMAGNRDGALYYVDLPVIGYGPREEMNIPANTGLLIEGRRRIAGYTLQVRDENFSFSDQERVSIILPESVLPVGSTPDLSNEFLLAGQDIQVIYDNAPVVTDLQRFYSSPLDRVMAANILVRHFLPAYVLMDITYSGGKNAAEIATELVSYINNIDPDINELRTDLIQDIIKRKGASKVDLPITLIALTHGTDRRIRGMRSTKLLGVGELPFFKGTFNQAYFISGPNTSGVSPRPTGEQIYLIQR